MNSDSSWNDARLDRAIDRAVRDLMHVDPPPGLRRRVLSQLDAPIPRRAMRVPRFAFAVAAVVMLVLAVILMRPAPRPLTNPTPAPMASGAPTAPAPTIPADGSRRADGSTPRATPPHMTRERIPMPPVANVFGQRTPSVSATVDRTPDTSAKQPPKIELDSMPPLTIVPLSARPIQLPPLVIDPLIIRGPSKGGL